MLNILWIFFFILVFIILLSFYENSYKNSLKKITSFVPFIFSKKEQEYNPVIDTNNWDLHIKRLEKFKRSQYKGLTFFVSPEDRIYYLSKKGKIVYC